MLQSKQKQEVIKRLNRVSGQIEGIKKMVEDSRYCVDILYQLAAVRAALLAAGRFVLEDHMKTCVSNSIKKGSGEKEIRELMDVFKRF